MCPVWSALRFQLGARSSSQATNAASGDRPATAMFEALRRGVGSGSMRTERATTSIASIGSPSQSTSRRTSRPW